MSSAVGDPFSLTTDFEHENGMYEEAPVISQQPTSFGASVSNRLARAPKPLDRGQLTRISFEDLAKRSYNINSNINIIEEEFEPRIKVRTFFTKEAERFIKSRKKTIYMFDQLNIICIGIENFMKKKSLHSKVIVDLSHDPEYPEWIEPSIKVQVKVKKYSEIYRIYNNLFETVFEKVPKKVLKSTSLVLEKI